MEAQRVVLHRQDTEFEFLIVVDTRPADSDQLKLPVLVRLWFKNPSL